MFTIMENRKRPRFEMINVNNNNSNENMQGVASTTTSLGTATLATIGGQSFILSNSSNSPIPANILLSICDEIVDESEEYIVDNSFLTPVKQEHTVATQTTNNKIQLQQTNLVGSAPQYRIINQAGKFLNTASLNSAITNNAAVNGNNSLVSNNLDLPPGCEFYVVKEVLDTSDQIIDESTAATNTSPKTLSANGTTIKLEPISPLPVQRHSTLNGNKREKLNSNSTTITINNTSPITCTSNTTFPDGTAKRSLILDTYKKRDDKRRAIHNEVERRRRDKINSWIFKLKELMPTENSTSNANNSSSFSSSMNQNTCTNRSNDSKSQILIRACEYIKSMQEEINSLRECLTENENLQLKNQRLQDEINSLRTKQQKLHNNSNMLLTTNTTSNNNNSNHNSDNSDCEINLNSLNTTYADVQLFNPSTNQNHHHRHLADLVGLTATSNAATSTPTSVNVRYAKRKLIITDYVD